jgi:hypothetical protein
VKCAAVALVHDPAPSNSPAEELDWGRPDADDDGQNSRKRKQYQLVYTDTGRMRTDPDPSSTDLSSTTKSALSGQPSIPVNCVVFSAA